jgi:membrane protein YqaA with SNARE-associated domain
MFSSAAWLLFASAFVSSTLLPGGSEVLFAALLRQGAEEPWRLLVLATAGNALGGMTSWGIGRLIALRWPARAAEEKHRLAVERVRRFGPAALLFSWLPVVGDPLCVAAGWLNIHWFKSLLLIALGKGLRYGAILWVVTETL